MSEKQPATFVATTRIRIQDLASIALYLHAQGVKAETKSGILNAGVKILANLTQRKYPVLKALDGVLIIEELGYGDSRRRGTKYYRALSAELSLEEASAIRSKEKMLPIIQRVQPIVEQEVAEKKKSEQKKTYDEILDEAKKSGFPLAEESVEELKETRQQINDYNKRVEGTEETDGGILDIKDAKGGKKKHKASASDLAEIDKKSNDDAKDIRKGLGEMPNTGE